MTFLNISLLGGAAAFCIPLIIHLMHRSRHRTVQWGAMHLLTAVVQSNKRRTKWQELLLLLVRCAIPIMLAICLARPTITGIPWLAGDAPASTALLLDNSYSMQVRGDRGEQFEQARRLASEILALQTEGSDASIYSIGGKTQLVVEQATIDDSWSSPHTRKRQPLQTVEADRGPASVFAALQTAVSDLEERNTVRRSIMVVSDFQRRDWARLKDSQLESLSRQLKGLPGETVVAFCPVRAEEQSNLCIESVELPRMAFGLRQTFTVRANLKNYGAQSFKNLAVFFRIDGRQQAASQISLGPNESGQATFPCEFTEHGSHLLEVEVEAADALRFDNRFQLSVEAPDRLPVLLVDGAPHINPLESETGYLRAALAPFAGIQNRASDVESEEADTLSPHELIATETIEVGQFDAKRLAGQRAVVLTNVARLEDDQLARLTRFVADGGGLLVFPGDRVSEDWYNEQFFAAGLLPARLGVRRSNGTPVSIAQQVFDHPVLEVFNKENGGDLSTGFVQDWFVLDDLSNSNANAQVIAKLTNGEAFLVVKQFGDGQIVLAATACDGDWSNLPLQPFYVPLMQRLAAHVALGTVPSRNVAVGQPLVTFLPRSRAGQTLDLLDPVGHRHAVDVQQQRSAAFVQFNAAQRPGLYVLRNRGETAPPDGFSLDDSKSLREAKNDLVVHFVAGVDRSESNLETMSDAELQALAGKVGATVIDSLDEYEELEQASRYGREIWKMVLAVLVVAVFAEAWLAGRITQRGSQA